MRSSAISIECLKHSPVAVLGFGRSGRAVSDFLLRCGNAPTVYSDTPIEDAVLAAYRARGVTFVPALPTACTESVLVRSPGLRPDRPFIREALSKGSLLTGEIDLFLENTPATVIGVTGSDGKSTTASMIAALLRAAGHRVHLGGNIGTPLLPMLEHCRAADFAVVELSSFQLMTAPAPDIAVITNLTPNHLNWHRDMTEYAAAKCRIFRGARALVIGAAGEATRGIGLRAPLPVRWFGTVGEIPKQGGAASVTVSGDMLVIEREGARRELPVFRQFLLKGAHNKSNFAAAVAATLEFVTDADILRVAATFRGVRHRLQTVATVDGVTFINSSIDTSPTRTAAALSAMEKPPLVIAGGRTKGIPLTPLSDALATHAKAVFLCGEAAEEIERGIGARVRATRCGDFRAAFRAAVGAAAKGDTVLLSPGCTAFDEFRDFEDRGDCFCSLVQELAKERNVNIGTSRFDPCDGGADERNGV